MLISQKKCLTLPSGEDIYLFKLRNNAGTEVLITNFGAIITSLKIEQPDKISNDIVLGFDKIENYFLPEYLNQYPWFGCAVGRSANRIKNAEIKIDAVKYKLSNNSGNDQLHGGTNGFDKKVWDIASIINSPYPGLDLIYRSKDGEEGFPGNLDVRIRFELNDNNELSYEYFATCDRPTVVNLSHHEYFNLNDGQGTIHEHHLKIISSKTLDQDENLVATGNISTVENTEFDFREYHSIGERMNEEGYDKSFQLDNIKDELKLAAEVFSNQSKVRLQIYTDEPLVHFYSGRWIPALKGKKNTCYGPFSGFCLETHKHPNAINIPGFPNTILRPSEIYRQKTVYKVSVF